MTSSVPLHRFTAFSHLSADEQEALEALAGPVSVHDAGHDIRVEGCAEPAIYFLHSGWAISSMSVPSGGRQIMKVHLPGDVMGAPSLPYARAVESLTALTAVRTSVIPLAALGDLFVRAPRLAATWFLAAQEERVFLMDRLAAAGRLVGKRNMAVLLVHLHDRLKAIDPGIGASIHLPVTLAQLGDMLGFSTIHSLRVLQQMEAEGHIRRHGRTIDLLDLEALRILGGLPARRVRRDPAWLPAS